MALIIIPLSIITFLLFGYDKQCAIHDRWRVPEKVLLGLSIVGGAMGGLLGMTVFHHKTKKKYFWLILTVASAVHIYLLMTSNNL